MPLTPRTPSAAGPAPAAARRHRSDGSGARAQLLLTALRLFSEKGFAKTSTRQIAEAAGANIAAISYYFGDKAGLYREVLTAPMGDLTAEISSDTQPQASLRQSLQGFFTSFLRPLKQGEMVQLCTRLHFREMLEPTGLWAQEVDNRIRPAHTALVKLICRELQIAKADDDVHRLAFSIAALALQMFFCRDVVDTLRPQLLARPTAVDLWRDRLVDYAEAMVGCEVGRRGAGARPVAAARPKKKSSHEKT
jgi:TetR/AcrR family transcriptional regulator, regulator of cefoperazone and chloramphenicol sensitivity